jgi:hypothetical protein
LDWVVGSAKLKYVSISSMVTFSLIKDYYILYLLKKI